MLIGKNIVSLEISMFLIGERRRIVSRKAIARRFCGFISRDAFDIGPTADIGPRVAR
jgi:hypothetical protein